jgi:hypothetical protein
MIAAALAWAASVKYWIYAGIAALLIAATVWILDREYDRGYVAGRASGDAVLAKASQKSLEQRAADEKAYRALENRFARIDHELAKRENQQAIATVERVRTVKEIVRENPTFGSLTRPDALRSVRDADFARLRDAAAAADVPANGIAGLPASGIAER